MEFPYTSPVTTMMRALSSAANDFISSNVIIWAGALLTSAQIFAVENIVFSNYYWKTWTAPLLSWKWKNILANHRRFEREMGKCSQGNWRARESCLITGFSTDLKLGPDSSERLRGLTTLLSEVEPSAEWIWADLEFFLKALDHFG